MPAAGQTQYTATQYTLIRYTPTQYTPIRFTESAALERLVALIVSISDAYVNAVAEAVMGAYLDESVAKNSPCAGAR
ncbi:hypothetical protein [Cryobacterium sp. Y29]|uniref:hypothetical protein n=1 Tax=Cryobacterium sp. Y29 TaxID=2048285 RepID=UPI000CE3E6AC|nr:hypothetical protein [Cryobacterium sp. Y29]